LPPFLFGSLQQKIGISECRYGIEIWEENEFENEIFSTLNLQSSFLAFLIENISFIDTGYSMLDVQKSLFTSLYVFAR